MFWGGWKSSSPAPRLPPLHGPAAEQGKGMEGPWGGSLPRCCRLPSNSLSPLPAGAFPRCPRCRGPRLLFMSRAQVWLSAEPASSGASDGCQVRGSQEGILEGRVPWWHTVGSRAFCPMPALMVMGITKITKSFGQGAPLLAGSHPSSSPALPRRVKSPCSQQPFPPPSWPRG